MDAYDRALTEVGKYGKFQKKYTVVYNLILVACATMVYMNVIMVLAVPPHHCTLPPTPMNAEVNSSMWKSMNIPLEKNSKGQDDYSSCKMFVNSTSSDITDCLYGYDYDKKWYHSTAASEHDWVCERELLLADAYAYSRLGEIVGGVTMGWIGDKFGRKVPYLLHFFLVLSGRVITIFSSGSFWIFLGGTLVTALSSLSVSQSAMLISIETSSVEQHTNIVMTQNIAWAVGVAILPLFYWWLREWYPFLIVTTLGLIPFFLMSWKQIESPRWLLSVGRNGECVKIMKRIAKENGNKLTAETEIELLQTKAENVATYGPLALFSSSCLALNTIILFTMWFSSLLCYGIQTMTSGEDDSNGNPFLRFFWQGVAEIPGYVCGACVANRYGRRFATTSAFGVNLLIQVVCLLTFSAYSRYHWAVNVVIVMMSKACITSAYNTCFILAAEMYPTCLRQTGFSLSVLCTGLAFALAPYVAYLGREVDARMPLVVLAIFSALGGISGSLLPETLNAALPETLEEAQVFGRNRSKQYFKLYLKKQNSKDTQRI